MDKTSQGDSVPPKTKKPTTKKVAQKKSAENIKQPVTLIAAIRQRMDKLRLPTASQVAAKMDLSVSSVSQVLNGKKKPSDTTLLLWADFLDLPVNKTRELAEAGAAQLPITPHPVATTVTPVTPPSDLINNAASLDEARIAYEAGIAAQATKGLSPRLLLLLRRLPHSKQAQAERLLEKLANDGRRRRSLRIAQTEGATKGAAR